ncbi:hypothetical protein ACFL0J_07880 [Candidatus Neomarinimicrobiota bacterium]
MKIKKSNQIFNDIDNSYREFVNFKSSFKDLLNKDLTESDTRSKIIDKLLINVLNWKEQDIDREGFVREGYYDYRLSLPGINIIIEAKKSFNDFILPSKHTMTSLRTLFKSNKEVIDQIRKYLFEVGTPHGVITNGKQFIFGKFFNSDSKSWTKNNVLIFNGFEDIDKRFIDFYNNLSRENVVENGGFQFHLQEIDTTGQIVLSSIVEREQEITRNIISAEIIPLINHIFGEVYTESREKDAEFIRECFIENKEIKKNRSEIERLFEDIPPQLNNVIPAQNVDSIVSQIQDELEESKISIKELFPPKPIIIVGSKGSGKTTFINYLLKEKFSKTILSTHVPIYLDYRKYFDQIDNFNSEKIAEDILDNIYSNFDSLNLHTFDVLKRIYFKEIQRMDEGAWKFFKENDINEYNKKLTHYLEEKTNHKLEHFEYLSRYMIRERRKRFIIIIDNADQFEMKIQENVFLLANSLNAKAHVVVILSLREGYYYKWRDQPPFDAYESNIYHITAPKYGEVLQKRIDYTLKKLKIDGKTSGETKKGVKIKFNVQHIIEFLSGLKNSLFSDDNKKIVDFLNYSTYPNIREGLQIFKSFLISGYTNVEEYILRERFSKDKKVTIPIHEFIKAIGLNNKVYYNHEISIINNLFYPTSNSKNHFLKIRILKYLSIKFDQGGRMGKFELYSNIVDDFVGAGYNSSVIQREIVELLKYELIDSDEQITDTLWHKIPSKDLNVCISPKGYYYVQTLKNSFHYIDLILQDTPIFNQSSFSKIKKAFPLANSDGKRSLKKRLNNVKAFLNYLKNEEKEESKYIIKNFGNITKEIYDNGLSEDIGRIEKAINRS